MAGKKNPNLGDKLRQEREGAENTLRDSRNKAADSSTGDSNKKKAEHRRQIRHEADLAKMRSKKLKSEQEVKAKKNAAASGKKGGKPKKPGNLAADALSAKAHQSVRNADQDNNSGVEAAHFTEGSAEEQPARVPGSSMVESCGSTKSWSGWRKRQIKMP